MSFMWSAARMASAVYAGSFYQAYSRVMEPGSGPMMSPRYPVSLIVPAYNEEKYIGTLLTSADKQNEPFSEYVIANSGKDNTGEIARGYGATVVPTKYGNISASRNRAADTSTGDILIFSDADMYLSPCLLEECVDALEEGYACAVPRALLSDSIPWNILTWGPRSLRDIFGNHGTQGIVAVWREVYDSVGGYDETCNPMDTDDSCREDRDFGERIAERHGQDSVKLLPYLAGTSARRYKAFGFVEHYDETPRHYLEVRD